MKKQRGITLIALVITIIVLLILAGVTISLTLGDNGIFKTAEMSVEEHIKSQLKEELELEILNIQTKKIEQKLEMKREDLAQLINIGATMENFGIPAEGEYKDYFFEVDENYKVTIIGELKGEKPTINGEILTKVVVESGTVEIKVTAQISTGSIISLEATNGAVLKTDIGTNEKIFEVSENGTYYFKATAENGRSSIISVKVDNILSNVIEFISCESHSCNGITKDASIVKKYLFDGIKVRQGKYGALLMMRKGSFTELDAFLIITVKEPVKIFAYGNHYSDVGGNTGKNLIIEKYDNSNYVPYKVCKTIENGIRYELCELEPGQYKLSSERSYVGFDEWELELVK